MKAVIVQAAAKIDFDLEEFDIDADPELRQRFNDEVPVLFIDGRKAFKYRVTGKQLVRKLKSKPSKLFSAIAAVIGKGES